MNIKTKLLTAAALAGVLAMSATPGYAAHGRNAAAAIGFGAGMLAGAAAANAANGTYYDEPGYAYEPGYAEAPVYAAPPAYAYEPERPMVYTAGPGWNHDGQCWISTDQSRGFGYYGRCAQHNEDQFNARQGDFRTIRSGVKP
jgi:hypothetical protein